jgi:hypothetical protein
VAARKPVQTTLSWIVSASRASPWRSTALSAARGPVAAASSASTRSPGALVQQLAGVATALLRALEADTIDRGWTTCALETAMAQPDAVRV